LTATGRFLQMQSGLFVLILLFTTIPFKGGSIFVLFAEIQINMCILNLAIKAKEQRGKENGDISFTGRIG
jgi:hypothetical protein